MFLSRPDPTKIAVSDLRALIDDEVIESRDIDYKRVVAVGPSADEMKKIRLLIELSAGFILSGVDPKELARAPEAETPRLFPMRPKELSRRREESTRPHLQNKARTASGPTHRGGPRATACGVLSGRNCTRRT
jgi:hypothetical protein